MNEDKDKYKDKDLRETCWMVILISVAWLVGLWGTAVLGWLITRKW